MSIEVAVKINLAPLDQKNIIDFLATYINLMDYEKEDKAYCDKIAKMCLKNDDVSHCVIDFFVNSYKVATQ